MRRSARRWRAPAAAAARRSMDHRPNIWTAAARDEAPVRRRRCERRADGPEGQNAERARQDRELVRERRRRGRDDELQPLLADTALRSVT